MNTSLEPGGFLTRFLEQLERIGGLPPHSQEAVIEIMMMAALLFLIYLTYRTTFSRREQNAQHAHALLASEAFKNMQEQSSEFIAGSQHRFEVVEQHLAVCNSDRKRMMDLLEQIRSEGPTAVRLELTRTIAANKESEARLREEIHSLREEIQELHKQG